MFLLILNSDSLCKIPYYNKYFEKITMEIVSVVETKERDCFKPNIFKQFPAPKLLGRFLYQTLQVQPWCTPI